MENHDAIKAENVYETRTCKECGATFDVSKSEVEDLQRRCGDPFALPLRCPACRAKKNQIFRICTCKKCGKEYTISLLEKEDYVRKGLELPKHCPECRAKMRRRHGGVRGHRVVETQAKAATVAAEV